MHFFPDHKFDYDRKAWRESPKKRRDALKTAILTKKSKIFIKAKLTVSKSCLLGLLCFMILFVLVDAILQKGGYFKNWSGNFLFYFKNHLFTLWLFIFQQSFVSSILFTVSLVFPHNSNPSCHIKVCYLQPHFLCCSLSLKISLIFLAQNVTKSCFLYASLRFWLMNFVQ